jgi:hypothetical protein
MVLEIRGYRITSPIPRIKTDLGKELLATIKERV